MHIARQIGQPLPIAEADVDALPAMNEILEDPSFTGQESKFYGGQNETDDFFGGHSYTGPIESNEEDRADVSS